MQNDVLERLYARRTFGIKPGLATQRALLAALGDPQEQFGCVHVAGTNGKGSVCAMLDAMIRAGGVRCGRYTSPHLVRFNERFVIDGEELADEVLAEIVDEVELAAGVVTDAGAQAPTFFECSTAIAFCAFARCGVALAVIETGLGGRLDATNVVNPLLSVITRIGLDHREWLGETLGEIAGEKAGIIKAGRPVVMGGMPDEAAEVVRARGQELGCRVVDATQVVGLAGGVGRGNGIRISGSDAEYGLVRPALAAAYQRENVVTAVAALEVLGDVLGVTWPEGSVKRGLSSVRWRGRFEVVCEEPPVVVDGAHNPDGALALRGSLKERFGKQPVGMVLGMCVEKDAAAFVHALKGVVRQAWCVDVANARNMGAGVCAELVRAEGIDGVVCDSVGGGLAAAKQWAVACEGVVVVCGSLFLVGKVLEACASSTR